VAPLRAASSSVAGVGVRHVLQDGPTRHAHNPGGSIEKTRAYSPAGPFEVRDCALAAIATGRSAQNLKELRDELKDVDEASVYFHFWGGLLRPAFDDPSYNNDFARWAHDVLHNNALAERLSVIDPTDYENLQELRSAVIETIEDELDESESPTWATRENRFLFVRSRIVIFGTGTVVKKPSGLPDAVEKMSPSSIFYHFIDARRRTPRGVDDFSTWLTDLNADAHEELCVELAGIDPYYGSLNETKENVSRALRRFLKKGGAR
jgi:hypothetical protein